MKFAFDLDGTITKHPEAVFDMMSAVEKGGHQVVVLTAVPQGEQPGRRLDMLRAAGGAWWENFMVEVPDDHGVSKAEWCRDHGVDVLVDNQPENMEALKRISPDTLRLLVV